MLAYPNVLERTITRSAKIKKEGIEAKQPGTQTIVSAYVKDDLIAGLLACRVKRFLSLGMQCLLKITNCFLQCIGALVMLVC